MLIIIFLSSQKCLKNEATSIKRGAGYNYNMDDFSSPNNLYGFSLSSLTSRILWRLKPLDIC